MSVTWTHPSLERAEYSTSNGRILFGCVIIAYLEPLRSGGFCVRGIGWRKIGVVGSAPEGLLMAINNHERSRS